MAMTISGCGPAPDRAAVTSFWVWNRDEPLDAVEQHDLGVLGVQRLFWQIGEMDMRGAELAWKEQHTLPASTAKLQIVPTIRIHASAADPLRWAASLIERVKHFPEVQIDFDCKTNRLKEYKEALHQIRAALPTLRLSITALAHWPQAAHWKELMQEVDEVFPMFYDLEIERPLKHGTMPSPMIDSVNVSKWVKAWRSCPVPWHLGLPNMTRLTVFADDGVKHMRSWDQVTLRSFGAPVMSNGATLTLWQPRQDAPFMALRRPASPDIFAAVKAARDAGAAGVIWFSLPQRGRASRGWSVAHLKHAVTGTNEAPAFKFTAIPVEGGYALSLTNSSSSDVIDDLDGCVLRLKVKLGEVREVLAGQFSSVSFFAGGAPIAVAREADEVRLSFQRLDAGVSLGSGLARFSMPTTRANLSWRVDAGTMHGEFVKYPFPQ